MRHVDSRNLLIVAMLGTVLATAAQAHPDHGSASDVHAASGRDGVAQRDRPNGAPAPMEAVDLPEPEVSITIEGEFRVIRANGLPAHETGAFPNTGNPNALRAQNHEIRVPLVPTMSEEPIVARPEFGIAVNGVIFDSGTGEFWTPTRARAFGGGSAWNYEALTGGIDLGIDMNHAHVQPTGKYHYHGIPTGLIESLGAEGGIERPMLVGWAFDGFPIYGPWGLSDATDASSEVRPLRSSYRLKKGQRPRSPQGPGGAYDGTFGNDWEYVEGLGDLDVCNGRFGVTPEFPDGTYYYVLTEEFPSIPRLWRGVPDDSMRRRPPHAPGPPHSRPRRQN